MKIKNLNSKQYWMSINLFLIGIVSVFYIILLEGCSTQSQASNHLKSQITFSLNRNNPKELGNHIKGDIIKIGIVASNTGPLGPWGIEQSRGAKLAVDEINKQGGIRGKKIKLMIEDCSSVPEQAKTAAQKLIANGALCLIGGHVSGIEMQTAQAAFHKGIPFISSGGTRADLTQIGSNVFRICYTNNFQGSILAEFAYHELGLYQVAILTDKKQPYSTEFSKSFQKAYNKLGGKIVEEQFYETGQTDFSAQLTNLKMKNPDGIFLTGYFTEVGVIARQASKAGLKVKFLGGDSWDSSELITYGGESILNSYYVNHYNNYEKRPRVKNFINRWVSYYKSKPTTTVAALSYDATALALDALKRTQKLNSKDLIKSIADTESFAGVTGSITLKDRKGDPFKDAIIVQVTLKGPIFAKRYQSGNLKNLLGKT